MELHAGSHGELSLAWSGYKYTALCTLVETLQLSVQESRREKNGKDVLLVPSIHKLPDEIKPIMLFMYVTKWLNFNVHLKIEKDLKYILNPEKQHVWFARCIIQGSSN